MAGCATTLSVYVIWIRADFDISPDRKPCSYQCHLPLMWIFPSFIAGELGTGNAINLSIVAMALSGFNNTKNALWLTKCKELHNQITDPYLRAIFTFLTCMEDDYSELLVGTHLKIHKSTALFPLAQH